MMYIAPRSTCRDIDMRNLIQGIDCPCFQEQVLVCSTPTTSMTITCLVLTILFANTSDVGVLINKTLVLKNYREKLIGDTTA